MFRVLFRIMLWLLERKSGLDGRLWVADAFVGNDVVTFKVIAPKKKEAHTVALLFAELLGARSLTIRRMFLASYPVERFFRVAIFTGDLQETSLCSGTWYFKLPEGWCISSSDS